MQTIGQFLTRWSAVLQDRAIDSPRLSVEVITAWGLGLSRLELLLSPEKPLVRDEATHVEQFLERRKKGEPLAYILGQKEFYGQLFRVSNKVLIPRPETELVVETVKTLFAGRPAFRFADICTGSGIIGITLSRLFPESRGVLLDVSHPALQVAGQNVQTHAAADRMSLACADLAVALRSDSLDLLVANPPYVPERELAKLSHEIRDYEPRLSLAGGQSGLKTILRLVEQGQRVIRDRGWLILEIGAGQLPELRAQLRSFGPWRGQRVYRDLRGEERVVALQKVVSETTQDVCKKKQLRFAAK